MIAAEMDLQAGDLPDTLEPLLPLVEAAVPAGVGRGHAVVSRQADQWLRDHWPATELDAKQTGKARAQFGTLGSGNHFAEVCLDEREHVWLVLHSGSRGIGNQLARRHIEKAKQLAKDLELRLEDPDLAYFMEGTAEFQRYIADMMWAQDYAKANRDQMMAAFVATFLEFVGTGREVQRINCHHNFTEREMFPSMVAAPGGIETRDRRPVWITRKGAIKADRGDLGVIPGSMGTRSYIVEGKGNHLSWNSCSHGAGRRLSRGAAKRTFTVEDLAEQMKGKVWLADRAAALLDEIPSSYKDIDQVMADQTDLVEVKHTLHQILNYKGA